MRTRILGVLIFLIILILTSCTDSNTTKVKNTPLAVKQSTAKLASIILTQNISQDVSIMHIGGVSFINSKVGYVSVENTAGTTDKDTDKVSNILMKTIDGGITWNSESNDIYLENLVFLDENTGFGMEQSGASKPVMTVDGGKSWTKTDFLLGRNFEWISVVSTKNIFFIGSNSGTKADKMIHKTVDGGKHWADVKIPGDSWTDIGGMSWVSKNDGYILTEGEFSAITGGGGQEKILYHTIDGGKTWKVQIKSGDLSEDERTEKLPYRGHCAGLKFFEDGTGYIGIVSGGIFCNIKKTTDKGKTFYDSVSIISRNKYSALPNFINKNEGFAISESSSGQPIFLYHTDNGGLEWSQSEFDKK